MRRINLLRAHGSPTAYLYKSGQCRCAMCRAANTWRNGRYEVEHREETRAQRRDYYRRNGDAIRARQAEYDRKRRLAQPGIKTEANRRRLYGITPDEWSDMFAAQGEVCAVCGTSRPRGKGGWHTDHDHESGRVRGILCHHCNTGLGHFGDSTQRLASAIAYLDAGRR